MPFAFPLGTVRLGRHRASPARTIVRRHSGRHQPAPAVCHATKRLRHSILGGPPHCPAGGSAPVCLVGPGRHLAARRAATSRRSPVQLPSRSDGEYWFASRTLDASQCASSQGPLQPELRVVVDTVPPQIEFTARPTGSGEVVTSWQAVDQNLLATSLKVEYQDGVGKPWKLVALQQPADDVLRTNYQGQIELVARDPCAGD